MLVTSASKLKENQKIFVSNAPFSKVNIFTCGLEYLEQNREI